MAVTYDPAINVGANAWRIRWSSGLTDPVFRVFVNGDLVNQTTHTSHVVTLKTGEHAIVEVLDDANAFPTFADNVGMRLVWPAVANTKLYRLERFNGSWATVAEVVDDGRGAYEWTTANLADTAHTYRVTAIGNDDNVGTPRSLTFSAIHHPDRPDVTLTYDKGASEVVVAAA